MQSFYFPLCLIRTALACITFLLTVSLYPVHADNSNNNKLETSKASYIDINLERILDGVIEAVNKSTVSSQTSGRVVEINYDINDYVQKDAILLKLRDTQQRANFDAATANFDEAVSEFNRVTELHEKKLVSKAELDKIEARRKAARAALDQAVDQLDNTIVRAPYSGIVTERHIDIGETAQPGNPLFTGLSLESLRAVVQLPQDILNRVRELNEARIIGGSSGIAGVKATELEISPYADPASHTFMARASLPGGDYGLFPGMAVKVAFATKRSQQLAVLASAVVHRSEVSAVYVVKNSLVSLRQVRVGRLLDNNLVAIHAGLEAGESVAVDPIKAGVYLKERQANKQAAQQ